MVRISVSTAITASLALLVLVMPRAMVLGALQFLRAPEMPQAARDTSLDALIAAYPQETFTSVAGERVSAPVLALSAGPYRHDIEVADVARRGIVAGAAVVLPGAAQGGTLVGKVTDVGGSSATVETLANPAWKTAVRIGTSSVDALLVGGLTPTLTLIPKNAPVGVGDVVYSVDQQLPYGLSLGTVAEVRDAKDGVLREATLAVPYTLSGLRSVSILKHAGE
jgi:cell shape-determining protein MreC